MLLICDVEFIVSGMGSACVAAYALSWFCSLCRSVMSERCKDVIDTILFNII